ncbi:hypothetical protein [Streptomyces broussonetiae]|uniref:Uncharacterized protein n=1 Tax=Streptomyces broussonetiae TaxID=2686304 RepID=A0A6I6N8K4_9ACTN|nr:hypothetical protein [Streptomyces broussonetiae]QHA09233.1 hypothetical protein GQF42_44015 [Streptomyces broussonetiae]
MSGVSESRRLSVDQTIIAQAANPAPRRLEPVQPRDEGPQDQEKDDSFRDRQPGRRCGLESAADRVGQAHGHERENRDDERVRGCGEDSTRLAYSAQVAHQQDDDHRQASGWPPRSGSTGSADRHTSGSSSTWPHSRPTRPRIFRSRSLSFGNRASELGALAAGASVLSFSFLLPMSVSED